MTKANRIMIGLTFIGILVAVIIGIIQYQKSSKTMQSSQGDKNIQITGDSNYVDNRRYIINVFSLPKREHSTDGKYIGESPLADQCKHAYILASHMSTIALLCGKTPSTSSETSKYIRNLVPRVLASIRALGLGSEFEQQIGILKDTAVSGHGLGPLQAKFLELRDNMYQETQMRFSEQVQGSFVFGAKFAVVETSLVTDVLIISSVGKSDRLNASRWTKDALLEVKESYASILPMEAFPSELLSDVDTCISILEKQEYNEHTARAIKTIIDRWSSHFARVFPYSG